jgi:hypothetical protein
MRKTVVAAGVAAVLAGCQGVAQPDQQTTFAFPGKPESVSSHARDGVYAEIAQYPGHHRFALANRADDGRGFPAYADRRTLDGYLDVGEAGAPAVERSPVHQRDGISYTRYQTADGGACAIAYRPFDRIGDSSSYRASAVYAACQPDAEAISDVRLGQILARVRQVSYRQP